MFSFNDAQYIDLSVGQSNSSFEFLTAHKLSSEIGLSAKLEMIFRFYKHQEDD